jgi:hypothetical protein
MKQSVKMWSKLPKALKEDLDEECLSLAIEIDDLHAVIEIIGCVNSKTGKVDRAVQRIIARAESYVERMPRHDGIRIIGCSYGGSPIDLGCCAEVPTRPK